MNSKGTFRPRGIGELLDDAIEIVRANWRTLLTVTAIVILPVAMAYSILSSFYLRSIAELIGAVARSAGMTDPSELSDPTLTIVSGLVTSVGAAYWLARVYLASTLYSSANALLQGRPPAPREMLKAGWQGFFPLLAVEAIFGPAVYVAALVTFPLLGLGGVVTAVLLSMAGPIVVIEGGIMPAFARSARLVRRHFWRVAIIIVGGYLIASQLESAVATPVLVREVVFGARGMSALTSTLPWGWKVFDGVLQGIAIAAVTPLLQLTTLLCYLDLRSREEGMDLIVRSRAVLQATR